MSRRDISRPAQPTRRAVLVGSADIAAATALGRLIGAAAAPKAAADPDAKLGPVALFGAAGSFGATAATGVNTVAVPGWGFGPGQAAFMSAVAGDGTVFVGTTPFTDDQAKPTGDSMELAVYEPAARRFTRLTVPSTTGRTTLPRPGANYKGVGGGDVSDVVVAPATGGDTAVFVSGMPYFGWDTRTLGLLPTVGQVRRSGSSGRWAYDPGASRTADALAASLPSNEAAQAFPNLGPGQVRSSRGAAAIARLPRSGHLVVAQYYGADLRGGLGQGALMVVDLAGKVRAFFEYPVVEVFGTPVAVSPREVVADPSSTADDERFVLISDCWSGAGQTMPFGVQEFSYRASAGTIAARSTNARAAQDGSRMETAAIAPDGTLYVARTTPDGLSAATLAVYPKIGGERGLVTRSPAVDGWEENAWGQTNPPDHLVAGTDRGGLVRSICCDPATGTVFVAGLSGLLQAVARTSGGYQVVRTVDLRLNTIRAASAHQIGLRRGAVDGARGVLWIPATQQVLSGASWPYAPFPLNQWLYRVNLRKLLA